MRDALPGTEKLGYFVSGSFAQHALAKANYLGLVPRQLSFVDAAPILCAGVTPYKGLKETGVRCPELELSESESAASGSWIADFANLRDQFVIKRQGNVRIPIIGKPGTVG